MKMSHSMLIRWQTHAEQAEPVGEKRETKRDRSPDGDWLHAFEKIMLHGSGEGIVIPVRAPLPCA
jgi:hypothetical protein